MNDGCRNRRYAHAIAWTEKFERNTRMIEKTVWYDEEDFTLDVHVNLQNVNLTGYMKKGKKSNVPDENLFASTNKMWRKVMFPDAISWYSAKKLLFVNENGIEVNKENYCKHLKKQLFPAIKKLVMKAWWVDICPR